MSIAQQIAVCEEHYKKWKEQALDNQNIPEVRKALERAFFWLELQSAFIVLHAIEQAKGQDSEIKKKLIVAKANLSRKLADYAEGILNEWRQL